MSTQSITIRLVSAAADHAGLDPCEIVSKSRAVPLCEARWACWLVMRERGLTLNEIGRPFARNHGSVLHGLKSARKNHGARDSEFRKLCEFVAESMNQTTETK